MRLFDVALCILASSAAVFVLCVGFAIVSSELREWRNKK